MTGGSALIDQITMTLRNVDTDDRLPIYIDIFDNSLSHKWLRSLNTILRDNYHLEKNYCFFGFADSPRNGDFLCQQINASIDAINAANLGYFINDKFTMSNVLMPGPVGPGQPGRKIVQEKFNQLHRYFEDLQGVSGRMSSFYTQADPDTKWHIRQLNLLCHEFESWALSYRKKVYLPEWQRPSQLMCWLNAPRFDLEPKDLELFGIDTLMRPTGGVFVGVNKAVGKHHWEVYQDEGRDSRIDELTTTTLRSQTEATGDFDIEWAKDTRDWDWMKENLQGFRDWLKINNFDPDDVSLTIGHPQCGQVNLIKSFGTDNYLDIHNILSHYLDVYSIRTSDSYSEYDYHWSQSGYKDIQISILERKN